MTTNGGENMSDETRNDTPERNDVRPGDRFRWRSGGGIGGDTYVALESAESPDETNLWRARAEDASVGLYSLATARLYERISPAPAAPKERALAKGWSRLSEPGAGPRLGCRRDDGQWACTRIAGCRELALFRGDVSGDDGLGACEAHAAEMGVFADADIADGPTGPVYCACIGAMCGCGRPKRPVSSARPLTFDEANPRAKACVHCRHDKGPECAALRDGHRLNVEVYCLCDCHPVEVKRGAKVAGKYDDHFAFFESAGRPGIVGGVERASWSLMQLGRAPGIDLERVKRPVGKVRPEYLEEIDVDFVGLLDADVRR